MPPRDPLGTPAAYALELAALDAALPPAARPRATSARDTVKRALCAYAAGAPLASVVAGLRAATRLHRARVAARPFDPDAWSPFEELTLLFPAAYFAGQLPRLAGALWAAGAEDVRAAGRPALAAGALSLLARFEALAAGRPAKAARAPKAKAAWGPLADVLDALAARDEAAVSRAMSAWLARDWKRYADAFARRLRDGDGHYPGRFSLLAGALCCLNGGVPDLPEKLRAYVPDALVAWKLRRDGGAGAH